MSNTLQIVAIIAGVVIVLGALSGLLHLRLAQLNK